MACARVRGAAGGKVPFRVRFVRGEEIPPVSYVSLRWRRRACESDTGPGGRDVTSHQFPRDVDMDMHLETPRS